MKLLKGKKMETVIKTLAKPHLRETILENLEVFGKRFCVPMRLQVEPFHLTAKHNAWNNKIQPNSQVHVIQHSGGILMLYGCFSARRNGKLPASSATWIEPDISELHLGKKYMFATGQ